MWRKAEQYPKKTKKYDVLIVTDKIEREPASIYHGKAMFHTRSKSWVIDGDSTNRKVKLWLED